MGSEVLKIRPAAECKWDLASLGEVMLRFDPGFERIRKARAFQVWEGGGEYNVARAMRKCWGLRATVATALPETELGYLCEDLMMQGGVDPSHILWRSHDGLGKATRMGLNFTEKGFGQRPALGCSDRGYSAASQLKPGEIDWEKLFGAEGVRWFHMGGIFGALGDHSFEVMKEAAVVAHRHGTIVSYDLNYRASLWRDHDGPRGARAANRAMAPYVDVLVGNEEDFTLRLGFDAAKLKRGRSLVDSVSFRRMAPKLAGDFPNLKVMAATLRNTKSALFNDWGAVVYDRDVFHEAPMRRNLEIYDRVGGGDGFATGLIFGFLSGKGAAEALDYGTAHGALVMTTPGDASMVTRAEVEEVIREGNTVGSAYWG